jgi:hypothetical protein
MARAIGDLLRDAALRGRLAEAGRAVALDEYDVMRLIPRVEALYTDLLAKKQSQ